MNFIETFKHPCGNNIAQFLFPDGVLRYNVGCTEKMAVFSLRYHHPELINVTTKQIPLPANFAGENSSKIHFISAPNPAQ